MTPCLMKWANVGKCCSKRSKNLDWRDHYNDLAPFMDGVVNSVNHKIIWFYQLG